MVETLEGENMLKQTESGIVYVEDNKPKPKSKTYKLGDIKGRIWSCTYYQDLLTFLKLIQTEGASLISVSSNAGGRPMGNSFYVVYEHFEELTCEVRC